MPAYQCCCVSGATLLASFFQVAALSMCGSWQLGIIRAMYDIMGNDILSVAVPLLATTILAVGIVVVAKPEPVMQILTGKNALERACSEPQNAKVISQIEKMLVANETFRQSVNASLNDTKADFGPQQTSEAAKAILASGSLGPADERAVENLDNVLLCMRSIAALKESVETERSQPFDAENKAHQTLLAQLWVAMRPAEPCTGLTGEQWKTLGFQGTDPTTDFRGMGLLGLKNLVYFAETYTNVARAVLTGSHHPKHGYSYAIAMINMTSIAVDMLKRGQLNSQLYHLGKTSYDIDDFRDVCCTIMWIFHVMWIREKPANMMAYPAVRKLLDNELANRLRRDGYLNVPIGEYDFRTDQ